MFSTTTPLARCDWRMPIRVLHRLKEGAMRRKAVFCCLSMKQFPSFLLLLLLLMCTGTFAQNNNGAASYVNTHLRLHQLDPSFDPNTVGGGPFCASGSLGTGLGYPPSFLTT